MFRSVFKWLCIISFLFVIALIINAEVKPHSEFERHGTKSGDGWQLNYTLISTYDQDDYYYLLELDVVCDKHTPVSLIANEITTKPCLPSVPASYVVGALRAKSSEYTLVVNKTYIKLNLLLNDLETDR